MYAKVLVVKLWQLEDNEIFILQCTTDWNKYKIDEILDISNELRNILSDDIIVQPVLITAVEEDTISSSKESAEDRKVKVITIEQLRMLLDKIKEDEKPYQLVKSLLI
jgi:hypothetical protein